MEAISDPKKYFFFGCKFFEFLIIKTLDPDSLEMLDTHPDSMNSDPQQNLLESKM